MCSNCFNYSGRHFEKDTFEMSHIRIFALEPVYLTNAIRTNILVRCQLINAMSTALMTGDAITLRQFADNPAGWSAETSRKRIRESPAEVPRSGPSTNGVLARPPRDGARIYPNDPCK